MKFSVKFFGLLIAFMLPMAVFAQGSGKPGPMYLSPDGKLYVKSGQDLYLRLSTSPEEAEPGYVLRNQSSIGKDEMGPFQFEGHGRHTIRHPADHRIPQKNKDHHIFYVYDDGRAPRTKVSVTKAPWVYNGNTNVYGRPGVKISLKTSDEGSGVFGQYFSLNSATFGSYESPIALDQEGDYTLMFYAQDNVGNESKQRKRLYAIDFTPPNTTYKVSSGFIELAGESILSPRSKIGLVSRDAKAGVKEIRYRFKGKRGIYKKGNLLTTEGLKDGVHNLIYAAEDRVKNAEANKTFTFYLDSIPPVVSHTLLGDQYVGGKTTYVSGSTTVELTATDNKAGVRRIRYYPPKKKAVTYSAPFGFPKRNGPYMISYAASDNVVNVSKTTKKQVTVDISPPKVSPKFTGEYYFSRKTHYVRLSTKISLPTTDNLSGVQFVSYIIDSSADTPYNAPFSLTSEGSHTLAYKATDNVNNESAAEEIMLFVDEKAPEIYHHFSVNPTVPNQEIYPLKSLLYLAATDRQAGIRNIFYSINDGKEIKYENPLTFKRRMDYVVKIRSIDNVGNVSTDQVSFTIR